MPEFTTQQIDEKIAGDPEMTALIKSGDTTEFKARAGEVYRRFGYKADGTPLRTAQKLIDKVSNTTGIHRDIVQGVAQAPLEIAGTAAGMAAGSPGGPAGTLVGGAGGNVLGAGANALLGITDPLSKTDLGVAALAPAAGLGIARAVPAAVSIAKRIVPGMGAGLNDLAAEQFAARLNSMRVTKAHVDDARYQLSKIPSFDIPVEGVSDMFARESADVAGQVARGIKSRQPYLDALNSVIKDNPALNSLVKNGKMSSDDLMTLEQGFNAIKSDKPGELWGAASGKLIDAMDAAVNNKALTANTRAKAAEGLDKFRKFIQVNNKYQADETIVKAMTQDGGIIKSVEGDSSMVLFDTKAFKKFLNTNATMKKAYSPAEIEKMYASVADLGYISKPPAAINGAVSLGKRYGAGGIIGGGLGSLTGVGAMVGAPVGMAVEEMIRSAVTTEPGRKIVKYLAAKGRGQINALELQTMLGKVTAGVSGGAVPGITGKYPDAGQTQPFENQQ